MVVESCFLWLWAMTTKQPPNPRGLVTMFLFERCRPTLRHLITSYWLWLHGHQRPYLRCPSLISKSSAQVSSLAVHLNNTLPGTQTSFVYWQDLAVSHFVFAHLHKHQMVPVSRVCAGALVNSLPHRCRWKSEAVWESLKCSSGLDAVSL